MPGSDPTAALSDLRAAVARLERGESVPDPGADQAPGPVFGGSDASGAAAAAPSPLPWDSTGRPPSWREATAKAPDLAADGAPQDPAAVARAVVLRQLTHSPKTRQQLRKALAVKEIPEDVAEAVLDRMEEVGLVDDVAYAAMLVRSKQAGRGLAKRALRHELRSRGVDDQTAAEALDRIDGQAERDLARRLVDKRLGTLHGLDATVQIRRLSGMLARKGYDPGVAYAVIREAMSESAEHRRD